MSDKTKRGGYNGKCSLCDIKYGPKLVDPFPLEDLIDAIEGKKKIPDKDKLEFDDVNKPAHYNQGNIECIEALESVLGPEGFKGYLQGNAIKYLWRHGYKGKPLQDLEKAMWYIQRLMRMYQNENEED